ncbi:putative zinc-binding protein [Gammaproteobacteria bacterium AB-CW1]|uniref:Zinc-binding protein n=1 Tax=Natronospira elongata TaxID=3110268 RepID=A0AAP6JE77_9GAMM|nr:putative zinc-binding protein [Gammaproteobacteria bacterium AB-CW1]
MSHGRHKGELPLVYSCSGCSSAAQLSNELALRLDRAGEAEMSCIAGVGGNVPKLVKTAQAGRPILAIDGCPLACTKACLETRDVSPSKHVVLSEFGVKKRYGKDFDPVDASRLYSEMASLARQLGD